MVKIFLKTILFNMSMLAFTCLSVHAYEFETSPQPYANSNICPAIPPTDPHARNYEEIAQYDDDAFFDGDYFLDRVYFAQTHVNHVDREYFLLSENRDVLLLVNILNRSNMIDSVEGTVPRMEAVLGNRNTLNYWESDLEPPTVGVPMLGTNSSNLGEENHSFDKSYHVHIPAEFVQDGMELALFSTDNDGQRTRIWASGGIIDVEPEYHLDLNVYFKPGEEYDLEVFSELESKLPFTSLRTQIVNYERPFQFGFGRQSDLQDDCKNTIIVNNDQFKPDCVSKVAPTERRNGRSLDLYMSLFHWLEAQGEAIIKHPQENFFYRGLDYIHDAKYNGGLAGFATPEAEAVSVGSDPGVLVHEIGHNLGLPHWGMSNGSPFYGEYPYFCDMFGIKTRDGNNVHTGPVWGYDLRNKTFLPPTVQNLETEDATDTGADATDESPESERIFVLSPMRGGGDANGDAPPGYLFKHFSDYSMKIMRDRIYRKFRRPCQTPTTQHCKWNYTAREFSTQISSTSRQVDKLTTGIDLPYVSSSIFGNNQNKEVFVVAIDASPGTTKNGTHEAYLIHPPIGPFLGTTKFLPSLSNRDIQAANDLEYCPRNGCDYTAEVYIYDAKARTSKIKTILLNVAEDESATPFDANARQRAGFSIGAREINIKQVCLLYTPNANTGEENTENLNIVKTGNNLNTKNRHVLAGWPHDEHDCASDPKNIGLDRFGQ